MALDVPFGLVDFVEVLQLGMLNPDTLFDFLNLGYKLSPSAGTDWPYGDVPGAVRSYVYIDHSFTPQKWFDGLRRGQTFVTNGPMLEFSINSQSVGSVLQAKLGDVLTIVATARLNPDIDRLDRLEVIEQGEVIKTISSTEGSEELHLQYKSPARHGTWFVLRAYGKQQKTRMWEGSDIVAMSAPIYVDVNGQGFWKPAAIPKLVEGLKVDMQSILDAGPDDFEDWDTAEPDSKYWSAQRPLLEQRINQAAALYDALADRAIRSR
jgi:hypothetical protein